MEAAFCIEAVEEALARYGKPEIYNTDQDRSSLGGLHGVLKKAGLPSRWTARALGGQCLRERLWRSIKYEEVYLTPTRRVWARAWHRRGI